MFLFRRGLKMKYFIWNVHFRGLRYRWGYENTYQYSFMASQQKSWFLVIFCRVLKIPDLGNFGCDPKNYIKHNRTKKTPRKWTFQIKYFNFKPNQNQKYKKLPKLRRFGFGGESTNFGANLQKSFKFGWNFRKYQVFHNF